MVQSSKKSFLRGLCCEQNTFLRAACVGAREAEFFFHELNFLTNMFKLFYRSEALKSHFEVAYVVSETRFCMLRARGAREAEFFFVDQFILPRRFQRGIARLWESSRSVFYSAGRQTDRQTHP